MPLSLGGRMQPELHPFKMHLFRHPLSSPSSSGLNCKCPGHPEAQRIAGNSIGRVSGF